MKKLNETDLPSRIFNELDGTAQKKLSKKEGVILI